MENFKKIAGLAEIPLSDRLSMIDTYLTAMGERLHRRHIRKLTMSEPAAIAFASMLAFKLGAVFYYGGVLAKSGHHTVKSLCLGGTAVKAMEWLGAIDRTNGEFLKDLFVAGTGNAGAFRPEISITKHHKSEVVLGLLQDFQAAASGNPEYMPAGEVFSPTAATATTAGSDASVVQNIAEGFKRTTVTLGRADRILPSFRAYHAAYSAAKGATVFHPQVLPPLGATDERLIDQVSIELKETREDPRRSLVPYFFLSVSAYCETWPV